MSCLSMTPTMVGDGVAHPRRSGLLGWRLHRRVPSKAASLGESSGRTELADDDHHQNAAEDQGLHGQPPQGRTAFYSTLTSRALPQTYHKCNKAMTPSWHWSRRPPQQASGRLDLYMPASIH